MKKYVLLAILCITFRYESLGEIVLDRFEEYKFKPILYFTIGFPFGFSSNEFFDAYQSGMSGNEDYANHSPSLAVGYKTWVSNKIRLGLTANFINSEFFDNFYTGGANLQRFHSHTLYFRTLPVIASVEYMPYDKQFRSYIGAGVGTTMSNIFWRETIRSSYNLDKRKGGILYDKVEFHPAARIYSGIELGFDEFPESLFLGSIIFEFSYTYQYRKLDIFEKVRPQLSKPAEELDNRFLIFPSYFTFNLSLSLNLLSQK